VQSRGSRRSARIHTAATMQECLVRQKEPLQVAVAMLQTLMPRSQPDTIPVTRAESQPVERKPSLFDRAVTIFPEQCRTQAPSFTSRVDWLMMTPLQEGGQFRHLHPVHPLLSSHLPLMRDVFFRSILTSHVYSHSQTSCCPISFSLSGSGIFGRQYGQLLGSRGP
jgi:hypothetical protein